jgi:hypothetical protein
MDRLEQRYRAAGEMIGTPAEFSAGTDRGVFPPAPSAKHPSEPHSDHSHSGTPIDQPAPPHAGLSHAGVRSGNPPSNASNVEPHPGIQKGVLGGVGSPRSELALEGDSSHTGSESIKSAYPSSQATKIRWPAASTENRPEPEFPLPNLGAAADKSTPPPFDSDPLLSKSPAIQSDPIATRNEIGLDDNRSQFSTPPGASRGVGPGQSEPGISPSLSMPNEGLPNNLRIDPRSPGINPISQQRATNSVGAPAIGSLIAQPSAPDLRRRPLRNRPAYLNESDDTWSPDAEWNPAVIE